MAGEGQTDHKAVRTRSGPLCPPEPSESRCLVTFGVGAPRSSIHTHQTCSLCQALHLLSCQPHMLSSFKAQLPLNSCAHLAHYTVGFPRAKIMTDSPLSPVS